MDPNRQMRLQLKGTTRHSVCLSTADSKITITLIYGERLVLSKVEGLVLKARPEGSRTMVMVIGRLFMEGSRYEPISLFEKRCTPLEK